MTREQALNYLVSTGLTEEQVMEVVEALEQEPCEDCISRQAVLEIAKSSKSNWIDNSVLFKRVNKLPPVKPQYTDDEIQKMQELEQAEIQRAYELGKAEQQTCEDAVSRAEAIKAMNDLEQEDIEQYGCHIPEGFDGKRAIEALQSLPSVALSAEPCEDAISRHAMHIELEKWIIYGEYKYTNATKYLYDRIDRLPSVNPQPKTGHWIFDEILDKHYYCSECKSMGVDYWDFCPNCGARMIEPQESEEV